MMKTFRKIVSLSAILVFAGCASSHVHFEAPDGARLFLDPSGTQMGGKTYTFPVDIDLPQTDNPITLSSNVGGRPIRMSLSDGTKLKGFLYVYKLQMDQVEKLAEVTFGLTPEQIEKLKSGYAVTVIGSSAGSRPVYKVVLGLDK